MVKKNVVPRPTSLSTPICPPCASTIPFVIASPRPSTGACGRLPEPVEHVRYGVWIDAGAGIGHAEHHILILRFDLHDNASAGLRELRRIADQILENLQQSPALTPDCPNTRFDLETDFQS